VKEVKVTKRKTPGFRSGVVLGRFCKNLLGGPPTRVFGLLVALGVVGSPVSNTRISHTHDYPSSWDDCGGDGDMDEGSHCSGSCWGFRERRWVTNAVLRASRLTIYAVLLGLATPR